MGYFLDINNSEYRALNIAEYNTANGKNGHTYFGVIASQCGTSIFMNIINKFNNINDSNVNDKNLNLDNEKKALNKELNKSLKLIGVDDIKNIDDKLEEQNLKIKQIELNKTIQTSKIILLQRQLKYLTPENDPNGVKQKEINQQISEIKEKLEAEEKELLKETKVLQEMFVNIDKAKNINKQLLTLKNLNTDTTDSKYDIKQEITDLSDFNKARKKFLKKPSKETAEALKKAYESIDNESTYTQNAYNTYLKPKIEEYLK